MKKKLVLDKKTVTYLTDKEQQNVLGGVAPITTSFGSCTGGLCCSPQPEITQVYTTCLSDGQPGRPDCK